MITRGKPGNLKQVIRTWSLCNGLAQNVRSFQISATLYCYNNFVTAGYFINQQLDVFYEKKDMMILAI